MMKKLLFFLLFSFSLYGIDHQFNMDIANSIHIPSSVSNGDSSGIVAGCVCPISGSFFDRGFSFDAPGSELLSLSGYYVSSMFEGWGMNTFSFVTTSIDMRYGVKKSGPQGLQSHYRSPSGSTYQFTSAVDIGSSRKISANLPIDLAWAEKGLTNASEEISAKTNAKNISIDWKRKKEWVYVTLPDGTLEVYQAYVPNIEAGFKFERCEAIYCLRRICRPSGATFLLDTTPTQFPKSLLLLSPDIKKSYSSIRLKSIDKKGVNEETVKFESFDGRVLSYDTQFIKTVGEQLYPYITHLNHPNQPEVFYSYEVIPNLATALLTKKALPENRYLEVEYYRQGAHVGMVKSLKAPVGNGTESIVTHRFEYHQGYTDVYNSLNHKTTYHYVDHRLTELCRYQGNQEYRLFAKEKNFWGKDKNLGNLLCKAYEDGFGNLMLANTYTYDEKGNVLEERVYGNLTGLASPLSVIDGNVQGGEFFSKYQTFSNDRFHNKLSETEDQVTTKYTYLPDTNLITSKIVQSKDGHSQRYFYEYDRYRFLTKTIVDDGNSANPNDLGVTFRKITKITPVYEGICKGLPNTVEEFAYDPMTRREIFLQKITNVYSREGWITYQLVFDSDNKYRYTIEKSYDRFGNVKKETDALGQVTERDFDLNGNLIYEKGPKGDSYTQFTYDFSNRKTSEAVFLNTGEILKITFTYDTAGNKISETDWNGNTTYFEYDEWGQVTKITKTLVADEFGNLTSSTEMFTYDSMGRVIASQDARGNVITKKYNSLGKPLEVTYPDGTSEKYLYHINGTLRQEIMKNGTEIHYEYDDFKRITRKTSQTKEGVILKTETYTYNAFHKISETDGQGITTTYTYDIFGREKTIAKGDFTITSEYDSLGKISKIIEGKSRVTGFQYDLLGQKIEERIEDLQGTLYKKMRYVYDPDGNVIEEIEETPQGLAITHKEYNPFHQVIKTQDALGHTSTIKYEYSYLNPIGQKVLRKIQTDPLFHQTVIIYDAHQRVAETQQKNAQGEITAKEEIVYDLSGNPILRKEFAIVNHQIEKEIHNRTEYNAVNQMTLLIEAAGTPEEKRTVYVFNQFGQKAQLMKPNQVSIHYQYDPLGRLSEQSSSDGSILYQYCYDFNDNLISVYDPLHQQTTTRKYDQYNRFISETQANGLTTHYQRDLLGRVISLQYPDQTLVNYTYNPLHLTQVTFGPYTHKYVYDSAARLQRSQLIGNAGEVHYVYDLLGQTTLIESQHRKQNKICYDPAGNLTYYSLQDLAGTTNATYTYDDLYQVSSESGISPHSYSHDSLNNRRQKDEDPYLINHLNQITERKESTYQYDPNGNMTYRNEQAKITHYRYDALDRLLSITTEQEHIEYTYDSFNRRISRTENQQTVNYLYQGNIEIGACQSGQAIEKRILGEGKKGDIGAAVAIQIGNKIYAPLHDHNGNLTALIDPETNTPVQTYRYTAFGEEFCYDKTGIVERALSPWRFSSKRKDKDLIHFTFRDYDPKLGRWITPDPIGFGDGPNLYAYVHNNPLTHIDQYGLFVTFRHYHHHHTAKHIGYCHRRYPRQVPGKERVIFDHNFINKFSGPRKCVSQIGTEEFSTHGEGFHNGILNTHEVAIGNARSSSFGSKTDVIHNPTLGLWNDINRYYAARNYMATPEVIALHEVWDNYFRKNPSKNSLYIIKCHSYGACNVRNALMSYDVKRRQQISVIAAGPGAYIDPETCRSVVHLVAEGDPIPLLDREGRKRFGHTIKKIKRHPSDGFFTHSYQSKTYQESVRTEHEDIIKQHLAELGL